MEEIVGLNPDKARRLVSSLRTTADRLVKLRSNLARAVQDARTELAPGGEHGPGTFTRYIDFLNESARDLEWRIRVITSGSLPPPTPDGIVTGKVGFLNEEEAKRQGSADGEAAGRDWLNGVHLGGNLDAWLKKLNEMIAKGQGDPAYATAFFLSLGAWLQDIISDAFYRYAGPDRVLDAQELEKARAELGPMAQMLALALAHGKLSKEYQDKLLGSDPRVLSLLLSLAPRDFPADFMAEAARKVLEGTDREAKIRALQALSENPDASLKFFQDLDNVRLLMHPELRHDADQRPAPFIAKIFQHVLNAGPHSLERLTALENFAIASQEADRRDREFGQWVSDVIHSVPGLADAISVYELLTGRDVVTQQELSLLESLLGLVPGPGRPPGWHRSFAVAQRLGIDLRDLESVPNSTTGRVLRPRGSGGHSQDEIRLADRIAEKEGTAIILPPRKEQPGIDGYEASSGRPYQFKTLRPGNNQPRNVVRNANEAYEAARKDGWEDVDLHIEAHEATRQEVTDRWNAPNRKPSLKPMPGGHITRIRVYCSDGFVDLPVPQ